MFADVFTSTWPGTRAHAYYSYISKQTGQQAKVESVNPFQVLSETAETEFLRFNAHFKSIQNVILDWNISKIILITSNVKLLKLLEKKAWRKKGGWRFSKENGNIKVGLWRQQSTTPNDRSTMINNPLRLMYREKDSFRTGLLTSTIFKNKHKRWIFLLRRVLKGKRTIHGVN